MLPTATLLVFTRAPEADSRRHPILPRRLRQLETDLRSQCLAEILAAGREGGLALAVASDAELPLPDEVERYEQRGESFATRLAQAVATVETERPGRPLVLVGSDLPGFRRAHLDATLTRLGDDPRAVVVGPSPDGGIYLLAAARPLAALLPRVDWCREHTCAHLLALLAAQGLRVELLPPLADLDRPRDLGRLLALARAAGLDRRLGERLLAAVRAACRALPVGSPRPAHVAVRIHRRRGPPA